MELGISKTQWVFESQKKLHSKFHHITSQAQVQSFFVEFEMVLPIFKDFEMGKIAQNLI